jgi:hypothetical protein
MLWSLLQHTAKKGWGLMDGFYFNGKKKMYEIIEKVSFPVLLPIFFCLHGWAENYSSISFGFLWGFHFNGGGGVLFLLIVYFTKKSIYMQH